MAVELKVPTKVQYDAAEPFAKGFLAYTFAGWLNSEIPEASPFASGTVEAAQFTEGSYAAMVCAAESED